MFIITMATQMNEITYDGVYYVDRGGKDVPINPIAIRPHVAQPLVWWDDTGHGRSFRVKEIKVGALQAGRPQTLTITTQAGLTLQLHLLTRALFDDKVRATVIGNPQFASDEELQRYYLDTNFEQRE